MESSRGGPLTTFIMMLPLIIVPTIAMLKPVDQKGSLLSSLLSAASPNDSSGEATDALGFPEDQLSAEPFGQDSGLTGEFAGVDDFSDLEAALLAEASDGLGKPGPSSAPRAGVLVNNRSSAPNFPGKSPGLDDADTEHLLSLLRQLGVTRTLWFSPGDPQSVGFVAFFQPGQGLITYRFEAISSSRSAAATDVLMQVKTWFASQNQ